MPSNSTQRSTHPLDLSGRAVLLATDGSSGAVAGAHVALALAEKHRAVINVIHVVDTRSAPIPPPLDLAVAMGDAIGGSAVHMRQERDVRAALECTVGRSLDWPVQVILGTPAAAIAEEAKRIEAALIIVGLRRHGRIDRVLNDETALEVMRNAACPILAVVDGTTELPVRVLAAMDFSETSLIAAQAARAVVGGHASVVLAYVETLAAFMPDDGELVIHDLGVQSAFARTARALGEHAVDHITVDSVVLHREHPRPPAELLLEYASGAKSDLIAAGSMRHGRVDRWLMGSVSTELVRDGRCSVLIVPPGVTSQP